MRYFLFIFLALPALINNVAAGTIYVDGNRFESLAESIPSIKDGSVIYLERGIYRKGAYISKSNISILGETGVVFDNAAVEGKAALVLTGKNVLVESIECKNISVSHGNGACIRFEGENLTVKNLYVHDSQSGIMTSYIKGFVKIEYSKFENLGNRGGYSHAMYINVDELSIRYSQILSTKNQGSGIKSRSKKVIVDNSVLASLSSKDSRLIDMANYGELIVKNSILQQGEESSNSQLISYGLEKRVERKLSVNRVVLKNNLVIFDRSRANVLLQSRLVDEVVVAGNIFVGDFNDPDKYEENNLWYLSREDAGVEKLPYLPPIHERQLVMDRIRIIGEAQND